MNRAGILRPHRRARRGYTLMELGVVLVLTVLLVFGMVRWLVGIGYSARTGIENVADQRISTVLEAIGSDVLGMRHCDTNGGDARMVNLAATTMTLVTDPDGDGTTETVVWRISGGDIQRGEAPMGEGCVPGTVTGWTTWVRDVEAFSVTLIRNGAEDPTGTSGTCTNEYVARCAPAPVQVIVVDGETTAKQVYGS